MTDPLVMFNDFMNNGGVIYVGILAAVAFIVYLFASKKGKVKPFKARNFEKEYEDFLKLTLKHMGEKVDRDWYLNGTKKGKVIKAYTYTSKSPQSVIDKVSRLPKINLLTDRLVIFSYASEGLMGKLGKKLIAVVHANQLVAEEPYYSIISDGYNFEPFTKRVFIFTKAGERPAERFAEIDTIKQLLEGQINYLPKIQYHDTYIGGATTLKREDADIQDKRFKGQKESAEE